MLTFLLTDISTCSHYPSLHTSFSFAFLSIPFIPFRMLSPAFNEARIHKFSYLILSYLILSYLILSYLILSYLILSYLILSYFILSLHTFCFVSLLYFEKLVFLYTGTYPRMFCTEFYCSKISIIFQYCNLLYCTALYYTVFKRILWCYTMRDCTALHCTVLYCTTLHCTVFKSILWCYTMRDCTALHCTVLHCTAVYCAVVCCTVLHCTLS